MTHLDLSVLPGAQLSQASHGLALVGCIVVLGLALIFFGRRRLRRAGSSSAAGNGPKRRRSLGGISRAVSARRGDSQV